MTLLVQGFGTVPTLSLVYHIILSKLRRMSGVDVQDRNILFHFIFDTPHSSIIVLFTKLILEESLSMEPIAREDVPLYLRNGSFFQNLDSSDREIFEVPVDCIKRNPTVENMTEFSDLLRSARFWGLDEPAFTVISFLVHNKFTTERLKAMIAEFPEYRTFLSNILDVSQQASDKVIFTAIKANLGTKVVKHLHEHDGFPLTSDSYIAAAVVDDISTFKYLQQQNCLWTDDAIVEMVINGSLQCFKHAFATEQFDRKGLISLALLKNQMEIAQFALEIGIQTEPYAMYGALLFGNVEAIRFLRQAGCAVPPEAAFELIAFDRLDCLIYVLESGFPLTPDLCAIAARFGRLRCLECLHLRRCPWDETTTFMAAQHGHLSCLRYAYQRGCPMTSTVTRIALVSGSIRCTLYCICHGVIGQHVVLLIFYCACLAFQVYMKHSPAMCGFAFFSVVQSVIEVYGVVLSQGSRSRSSSSG